MYYVFINTNIIMLKLYQLVPSGMYYVFINTNIIILKLYQLVPSGFPFDLKLNMMKT